MTTASQTAPVTTARLQGRRAVVTGGCGGIGAAIVARLVAEGAAVAVIDLCGTGDALPAGVAHHRADLACPRDAVAATEAAMDGLGGADLLVNCAGVLQLKPLLEITVEDWDAMLAVNARPVLLTMQVLARRLIVQGRPGAVVNIASMAAKTGGANEAHYAAAKSAVVTLTRAAALEWGPAGIRVNAVCPGFVPTAMGAATRTDADVTRWSAMSPLGRLATPDDVAATAAFLLCDDAAYLTGQAVNVSGGMVMH